MKPSQIAEKVQGDQPVQPSPAVLSTQRKVDGAGKTAFGQHAIEDGKGLDTAITGASFGAQDTQRQP